MRNDTYQHVDVQDKIEDSFFRVVYSSALQEMLGVM